MQLTAYNQANHLIPLISLIALIAACRQPPEPADPPTVPQGEEMFTLGVDFQDGLKEDTVVLFIDGEEAFRKEEATSKELLGDLATTFTTQLEKGPVSLEIGVPTRDLKKSLDVDLAADTYVGVQIINGQLEFFIFDHPIPYG